MELVRQAAKQTLLLWEEWADEGEGEGVGAGDENVHVHVHASVGAGEKVVCDSAGVAVDVDASRAGAGADESDIDRMASDVEPAKNWDGEHNAAAAFPRHAGIVGVGVPLPDTSATVGKDDPLANVVLGVNVDSSNDKLSNDKVSNDNDS